jgi:membrane-associated phospholipid phosphatase
MADINIDTSPLPAIAFSMRVSSAYRTMHPAAKRYIACWVLVVIISVVSFIWMSNEAISVQHGQLGDLLASVATLIVSGGVLYSLSRIPRYEKIAAALRLPEISSILGWIALVTAAAEALVIFQFSAVAVGSPLIDSYLLHFDRLLGFSWPAFAAWQMQFPVLNTALAWIYRSYGMQVIVITVILSATRRFEDLSEFAQLFIITALAAILISIPFPATNPKFIFGLFPGDVSEYECFLGLRNGSIRIYDLTRQYGLVSMPSLHAAGAILLAYAVRNVKWLYPCFLVLNTCMVYSAIACGAHYLVDIIAGLTLAVVAIATHRGLRERQEKALGGDHPA